MTGWLVLLIVLAVLTGLALTKCGIHVQYAGDDLQVEAKIGPVRLNLLGGKPPAEKKRKKAAGSEQEKQLPQPAKKKNAMDMVRPFLPYWREILAFCGRVLTAPTMDFLRLKAQVGGRDASSCALQYGRICAAAGVVLPVLQNTFRIKKQEISIEPDFQKMSVEICGEGILTLRIYEILVLACAAMKLLLRIRSGTKNNKRAVQTQ